MGVVVPSMSSKTPRMHAVVRLDVVMTCFRFLGAGSQFVARDVRKMRNAETYRKKILISSTIRVVWRPTSHVLKQADCSNSAISAEVKPVPGPARNTNQVPSFNLNGNYRSPLRMDMEQSMPGDYEPYFVFVMPVFAIELCQHRVDPRRFGAHINHVSRDVTTASFQLFDLFRICAQDLFRWCILGDRMIG